MDSAREYAFAGFTLNLHRGVLRDGSDAVDLRPKTFRLLACLVENAGRVIPKEELLDTIWPGVTVTEDSLTQCIGELRRALGQAATAIRTVPRRGYVFEEAALEAVPAARTAEPPATVANGKPSIAVMPFRNLSSDPEQDYFADGIAEDITAALGHFRQIKVISRNSAFSFKGLAMGSANVGRELGVRYLLQGSIRKSGERLRLTAHLVEAESDVQLWADQLDGVFTDVFAFQDKVTRRVIGAIAPRVMRAELERSLRRRPESLDAYDLYLRTQASLRDMTRAGNDLALSMVERALLLEPDYAAMAGLGGWAYTLRAGRGWSAGSEEERRKGIALAARAMATGQEDAEALSLAGYTIGTLGARLNEGIKAIDRAISLNPNSALALTNSGWLNNYLGLTEIAIANFELAKSLSPRDPGLYRLNTGLCCAFIQKGDFNAAIGAGREATMDNLNYVQGQRALAAALALAGQVEDARRLMENMLQLEASLTVSSYASTSPFRFSGKFDQLLKGLRLAGLPE